MGKNTKKDLGRSVQFLLGVMILSVLAVITALVIKTLTSEDGRFDIPSQTEQSSSEAPLDTSASDTSDTSSQTTTPATTTTTTTGAPSQAADMSYLDDAAFVGDSITYGLFTYGKLGANQVLAYQSMNIDKINTATIPTADYGDITILDAIGKYQPKKVYIMIGSNGIAWLSIDGMIENYRTFVSDVQAADPDCLVYILSIPPIAATFKTEDPVQFNLNIDEYNGRLQTLADELGVYYLDFNAQLKDANGYLKEEYNGGDGMHFKSATYDVMLDYVLTHTAQ